MGVDTAAVCAEFIGTFLFVLVVLMSTKQGDPIVAALPVGIGLAAMIYAFGGVSGGHFNPAVSTAVVANKGIDGATYVSYLAAQFLGGLVAVAWYGGAYTSGNKKAA